MTAPGAARIAPELLRGLAERAARPDFPRLEAQLRSSGYCARPVRLRGHIETCDGHGHRRVWTTDTEPDGVLRKACGNRREAVCPPCSERYRQDAYHLIAAGLRGGKGVPDTVAEHPAVFVTLTAPSFGVVHSHSLGPDGQPRRCRPRRDAPLCEHGNPHSCGAIHAEDDACLGEPLCAECFDYEAAVVWNNTVGQLWRYTTIYVRRALARQARLTRAELNRHVRPAYAKVAEYQRRGLVHLHVLARLDRAMPAYRADEVHPPPARFDADLLEAAIRTAVADVSAPVPPELGGGRVRWATSSTPAGSRPVTSATRSPATSPSTRPRAPNRPADCCTGSTATTSTTHRCANTSARTCAPPLTYTRRRPRDARRPRRPPLRRRPTSRPPGTRPRSRSAPSAR
jgi:hypothetical protein